MSYNNYTDGDAARAPPTTMSVPAIIKHANPCGIAVADEVAEVLRPRTPRPRVAFGGVIAVNRPVSVELARQIVPIFTEVVLPLTESGKFPRC